MQRPPREPIHRNGGGATEPELDVDWDDVRERAQARWMRLNERDLEALRAELTAFSRGNSQLLVGRLRERYGIGQFDAEDEVRRFVHELWPTLAMPPGQQQSRPRLGLGRARSER